MLYKVVLNTKPFGKFIISQEAFSRILEKEYFQVQDKKSEIVQQLPLNVFNRVHGLDWSSPDIFFTEKKYGYKTHSVLPIFLKNETVYYFQDSVEKNKLTISRTHDSIVETLEELKEDFNSSTLDAKIFSVPFTKDLAIGKDRNGVEYYYYFQ
jgi:hypothetical protein